MGSNFFGLGISFVGLLLMSLLGFAGLQWLQVPVGRLIDWIIGGASFWWLLVVVTVPWNVHFQAKAVLMDGEVSRDKNITVDPQQLAYAKLLARRSLLIALVLHVSSAIGLYGLAAWGISAVGYIGSAAAFLLTGVRPAIGAYQYFSVRLAQIQHEFRYPREDIYELRGWVLTLEDQLRSLEDRLNPENAASWVASQQRAWDNTRQELARLVALHDELRATNQVEHDRLGREARQAIAQLTTDGQFLDHVREIIRFFKTA